jgi:zinc D-Ala-D-Ala dipeptidase
MWDRVKGTPYQRYVANPGSGSIHNYGAAVDLTIADTTGTPLDMGTSFDSFLCKSQPRYESYFIDSSKITDANLTIEVKHTLRSEIMKHGLLSPAAHRNRLLLREIMESAEFKGISIEWWHFNAFAKDEIRKRFVIIE